MTARRVLAAVALLAPAVAVFAPGLGYPFLGLDDVHHVVQNPAIRDWSWAGLRHLFFEDARDLRYFPVSYLSFALDHRLFGLDPFFFHATNLALHLANTLLVARLVGRVLDDRAAGFWTALLFSIHPLQVESVAWVMSRKNVLFLLFFLLAALADRAARDRRRGGQGGSAALLGGAAALYLVACLTKTTAATLPAVLLWMDALDDPDARRRPLAFLRRALPSKLPYLPPAALVVAVTLLRDVPNPFRTDFGFSALEWIGIVGHNFAFYGVKTLWPTGLAAFVPLPAPGALPGHFVAGTLAAAALLAATAWAFLRGARATAFGLGWYLLTIAPNTVYAVFFSDLPILVADRYVYQSALGLLVVPVAAGLRLWRAAPPGGIARPALAAGAVAAVAGLCVLSARHRSHWRSDEALYESIVARYPSDEFYYRLALAHAAAGRRAEAFRALDAAERAPARIFFMDFLFYRLKLAGLQLERGATAAAAAQVEAALEATPNAWEPFDARTPLALRYLADLRQRAGDAEGAARARARALHAATEGEPAFVRAWVAAVPDDAERFLQARTRSAPGDGAAWYALGQVAERAGDPARARALFGRAAALGHPPAGGSGRGP